jgi:hypothetical protein
LAQLEKELAVTGKAIQELGSLSGGILQFIKKDSG